MTGDLFSAAIEARDRRIARLERDLAEARAEADALRAELAERAAGLIVTGDRVAIFPSTRRVEYVAKALDQIARIARPAARERVIEQRVEDTFARLLRYGLAEDVARADADALGAMLRAAAGSASFDGGRSA